MKICLLASGSKGNSVYLETCDSRILVDAGCSAREIFSRLSIIGVDPSTVDAILLTHEHTDHISGAGVLSRKLRIPVILSHLTLDSAVGNFSKCEIIQFEAGEQLFFRDIRVDTFPITHDACDPVGFVIESAEGSAGVATDLGVATRLVKERLKGCRALVLESNHDEEMLINGPYPWHLKQRIRSRHGHLSNSESVELLQELLHDGLQGLFLAHLSEVNNCPVKAREATAALLESQNACNPKLLVGCQHKPSEVLSL